MYCIVSIPSSSALPSSTRFLASIMTIPTLFPVRGLARAAAPLSLAGFTATLAAGCKRSIGVGVTCGAPFSQRLATSGLRHGILPTWLFPSIILRARKALCLSHNLVNCVMIDAELRCIQFKVESPHLKPTTHPSQLIGFVDAGTEVADSPRWRVLLPTAPMWQE